VTIALYHSRYLDKPELIAYGGRATKVFSVFVARGKRETLSRRAISVFLVVLVFEQTLHALCCQLFGFINRSGKLQAF
tara:strand:+ start:5094 stop:5327 length:234 start_codon:yes stop_codon:yes gene_type:complete